MNREMESRAIAGGKEPERLSVRELTGEYTGAFMSFLDGGGEAALERAYEIGRQAIDGGLGVLDIAAIHEDSLKRVLNGVASAAEGARVAKAAEDFFAETLAPFEMAQRGYVQANFELRELTKDLERKVEERTQQLRAKDRAVRQAYIDVFSAVTGGRLIIMGADEVDSALGRRIGPPHPVSNYKELAGARAALGALIAAELFAVASEAGLILAFNEALTNAVKHAGRGEWRVYVQSDRIQLLIADSGPGIDFSILPKATLMAGFSTKPSLGVGFSIMLESCDRVLLATEKGGTSIVLEMSLKLGKRTEWEAGKGVLGG